MSTKILNEEIYFNGGLDTDSDYKYVKQGDYVDALNISVSEDGNNGVVVNVKGNEPVYTFGLIYTQYLCGWTFYDKNDSVILFLYTINNNTGTPGNVIVEYNPITDDDTVLINNTTLGFQNPQSNDYHIKADILGDWLSWTDNVNVPGMINISDISTVTDLSTYIELHKRPPTKPPTFNFGLDDTYVFNNIVKPYQFKYNYVYKDYRQSTYSPSSDIAVGYTMSRANNDFSITGKENYIDIKFNSGNNNVGFVNLAVREGNAGSWFRFMMIDKSSPTNVYTNVSTPVLVTTALTDNTEYLYRFYNNESKIDIPENASKLYDNIPDKCETLSFIGDNRLVLAGGTDGKDLIDIDVTLSAEYNNPGFYGSWTMTSTSYTNITVPSSSGVAYINFDLDTYTGVGARTTWYAGNHVNFKFEVEVQTTSSGIQTISTNQYVVLTENIYTRDDLGAYLASHIQPLTYSGGASDTNASYNDVTNVLTISLGDRGDTFVAIQPVPGNEDDSGVFNTGYDYGTLFGYNNDLAFKRQKTHQLGLIYSDKYGKRYPVLTSSDSSITMDSIAASGDTGFAHIEYTITNDAPSDAVSYRWAYAYKPSSFYQTFVTDASYFEDSAGELNTDLIALDISGNGQLIVKGYNIEVGDKIKVIIQGGSYTGTGTTFVDTAPIFTVEDVKNSINDGTNDLPGTWIIVRSSLQSGYTYGDFSNFVNALIEIYKEDLDAIEDIFYEIGNGGDVNQSTLAHEDWDTGTNTGYINQGDVWVRPLERYYRSGVLRENVSYVVVYLETPYPYSGASARDVGIGDVNIEYPESRSKYDNTLLWSNKFFQDTKINGLSVFDFADKKDVSDNFGKIKGLEELGNVLTIICEEKVLTAYVGATEYTDASGNVNVVKSTVPIGYIRPHAENYGTYLKESILNTGRYVYFYDINNRCVVRKAYNGLYPISGLNPESGTSYNMITFFNVLSDSLLSSINSGNVYDVRVYAGYDPRKSEVYFTIRDDNTESNNLTVIFNENRNRWISKLSSYTFATSSTFMPFTKQQLMAFQRNELYLYNSSKSNRCYLFGAQQSSYIQFISHTAPNQVKVFNAIGVHSDNEWEVDPIEIDATDSHPNGMYTKILPTEFIKEEGVYKAYIPKNMKTRTSTATNYDRITGDDMRGYVMKIKMTNDDTTKTELFKVDINSELSR